MGRTIKTQVALYLTDEKVRQLREVSKKAGRTQQDLLREGVDWILAKYRVRASKITTKHR